MSKPGLRLAIAKRAGGCCEYCKNQERYSPDTFSIEHIVPRKRRGSDAESNLALACQGCNNCKYTRVSAIDPLSGEPVPLFHPRKQQWDQHFEWSDDFSTVIGITPIGRATVDCLKLNRSGAVNLRRILASLGKHPLR